MMKGISISRYTFLIFLFHLTLASYFLDHWPNPNTTSRVLQVKSLHENQALTIDSDHEKTIDKALVNGHYYPLQPPLPSLLLWPVYEFLDTIDLTPQEEQDQEIFLYLLGAFLFGSVPFAFLVTWITLKMKHHGTSLSDAFLRTSFAFYGSMFFIYAGTFYSHLLVALLILLAYHWIQEKRLLFLAGITCGAAFFSEYLTAIIFATWFFLIWKNQGFRNSVFFCLGLLPGIAGFLIYNFSATGNPLLTPYSFNLSYDMEQVGFTYPHLSSLLSMFFLPWRGAYFYVPILWTLTYVFWRDRQFAGWRHHLLTSFLFLPSLLFILALSSYQEWHGGWTFGPRYLFPVIGMMLFYLLPKLGEGKWTAHCYWIPVSFGLCYAFVAKSTVLYSIPSSFNFPLIQYVIPKFIAGTWNNGTTVKYAFHIEAVSSLTIYVVIFVAGHWMMHRWLKSVSI